MPLRLLAIGIGIFFVAMGLQKTAWLFDSGPLLERFARWRPEAAPITRWYLDTVAVPGTAVFARMVPLAELGAGLALILGLWTRVVAALALIMVVNFHLATGAFLASAFLRDGTGPPLFAGLLALAIGANHLPLTVTAGRRRGDRADPRSS